MGLFEKLDFEIPIELREFVLGVVRGETDSAIHYSLPMPPTGFPLLVYVYKDFPKFHVEERIFIPSVRLNIAGQISKSGIKMEIDCTLGQIGLVLHPTATYYLFHKSGDYFLNMWKDLKEALPLNAKNLFDSIDENTKPLDCISIILENLKELAELRISAIDWLDRSLVEIFKRNGNILLTELVDSSNISERHYRRKFKEVIGLPPKFFCKVIQLNSVFEIMQQGSSEKLHALALDLGYYDQAHFINDFNRLIGETPVNFLNGKYANLKSYLGRKP